METKPETSWTVGELIKIKEGSMLRVNPEYQRGLRWSDFQKQMFIDSIMRGYSIPAFYLHEIEIPGIRGRANTFYEIIDGQQRIDAIYGFSKGSFELLDPKKDASFKFPNFVKGKDTPWAGKRFSELDESIKVMFLSHKTVTFLIKTDDPNEVRDLFIRLQAGTPLTPQDKRDAWPGNFTEFVLVAGGKDQVDEWYGWDLFKQAKLSRDSNRRSLVAQSYMLFQNVRSKKGFYDIKSRDIDNFYHEHIDFDPHSEQAKAFKKVCDLLAEHFKRHPKIVGYQMIDLILYADSILRSDYVSGWESRLPQALHDFNEKCRQGSTDNKEDKDTEFRPYFTLYSQWGRVGSDTGSSIRKRQEFFSRKMDELVALTPKDPERGFTNRDKERIFYRDNQQCQHCAMSNQTHRVDFDNAEIHHVMPHHQGGRTSIENGALVHKDCHPKAQTAVENFRMWWESEGRGGRVKGNEKSGRVSLPQELPPDGTQCRWSHEGKEYLAEIRDRKIHSLNSEFPAQKAFSTAIKQIAGITRNGWDYWEVKLPDSERWVFASDWRRSLSQTQAINSGGMSLAKWEKESRRLLDVVRLLQPETTMEEIEAIMVKKYGLKPSV